MFKNKDRRGREDSIIHHQNLYFVRLSKYIKIQFEIRKRFVVEDLAIDSMFYCLRNLHHHLCMFQVAATLAASTLAMIVGANVALSSSIIPILLKDGELVQDFTEASWIGNLFSSEATLLIKISVRKKR